LFSWITNLAKILLGPFNKSPSIFQDSLSKRFLRAKGNIIIAVEA
jgi:hypothetical protein